MKNFANLLGNSFSPYEEDYNTDFKYENENDNPEYPIEEDDTREDYNFYPDACF